MSVMSEEGLLRWEEGSFGALKAGAGPFLLSAVPGWDGTEARVWHRGRLVWSASYPKEEASPRRAAELAEGWLCRLHADLGDLLEGRLG